MFKRKDKEKNSDRPVLDLFIDWDGTVTPYKGGEGPQRNRLAFAKQAAENAGLVTYSDRYYEEFLKFPGVEQHGTKTPGFSDDIPPGFIEFIRAAQTCEEADIRIHISTQSRTSLIRAMLKRFPEGATTQTKHWKWY